MAGCERDLADVGLCMAGEAGLQGTCARVHTQHAVEHGMSETTIPTLLARAERCEHKAPTPPTLCRDEPPRSRALPRSPSQRPCSTAVWVSGAPPPGKAARASTRVALGQSSGRSPLVVGQPLAPRRVAAPLDGRAASRSGTRPDGRPDGRPVGRSAGRSRECRGRQDGMILAELPIGTAASGGTRSR